MVAYLLTLSGLQNGLVFHCRLQNVSMQCVQSDESAATPATGLRPCLLPYDGATALRNASGAVSEKCKKLLGAKDICPLADLHCWHGKSCHTIPVKERSPQRNGLNTGRLTRFWVPDTIALGNLSFH